MSGNAVSGNTVDGKTVALWTISGSSIYTQVKSASTDRNGAFSLNDIPYGTYVIEVKNAGTLLYAGIVNVLSPTCVIPDNSILLGGEGSSSQIVGTVKSAVIKDQILSGVTVKLYQGNNITNITGYKVGEVTSLADGSYTFKDLKSGIYTIVAEKQGYIRYVATVIVRPDETVTNPIIMSDRLTGGNDHIRFVLTWNKNDKANGNDGDEESTTVPRDLDSHLFTPDGHHTWYGDKLAWKEGTGHEEDYNDWTESTIPVDDLWARLDVDDVTYEGPETTSVYNIENGVYHFYVHQYSDKGSLKTSGAVVQIYVDGIFRGACALDDNTKNVDSDGKYWDVCSYDSTTNTLTINDEIKASNYAGNYDIYD